MIFIEETAIKETSTNLINKYERDRDYNRLLEENKRLRKELKDYIRYKDILEQVIESDKTLIQVYEKNIKYYKNTLDLYREKLRVERDQP